VKRKHQVALQLFEGGGDYEQFKHDQTYAGTKEEKHFEDIFITNTAYVALSRLFFVRICEDEGLTTRKVSHNGPAAWRKFVQEIRDHYQDLLLVAYLDVRHIYSQLFEETVFDWFGRGNSNLHKILERILFQLNAFNFANLKRELLGSIYQSFRPKAERKRLGEYYTPDEVVDFILAKTGIADDPKIMEKTVLDPACGSFTFGVRALIPLLKAGSALTPENKIALISRVLKGQDINPFSVFIARLSLIFALLPIYLEAKRKRREYTLGEMPIDLLNSLTEALESRPGAGGGESPGVVDYVVGNPPFVRNERLPEEDRKVLDEGFQEIQIKNTDISTYFLYCGVKDWLVPGGKMGMVAPIGLANTAQAGPLRALLTDTHTVYELVSLEWMAKEVFPEADIIPMLVFAQRKKPDKEAKITIVSGLRSKAELRKALTEPSFYRQHTSELDYQIWRNLSPTGDWPLEIKSQDVSILQKLKDLPLLEQKARVSFAIKAGTSLRLKPLEDFKHIPQGELPFAKGQNIAMFGCDPGEETIKLSEIKKAEDPSIWGRMEFYTTNEGLYDDIGLGRSDLTDGNLFGNQAPSDTRGCLIPEIYVTLMASVIDPLKQSANNSAMVLVPYEYSAHVHASIVNSPILRYYSFLLMRSAILLRRRSTWFPRAIKNLPFPKLTPQTAKRLHSLSVEAHGLSEGATLTELDVFLEGLARQTEKTKAGYLGVKAQGEGEVIDLDDLLTAKIAKGKLEADDFIIEGPGADTLLLVKMAILASEKEEYPVQDIQDLELPSEASARIELAGRISRHASTLEKKKERMEEILKEIDEVVAEGLGLTSAEHGVIIKRCKEFPLSVTVNRPRFVWSPDRKRQARRVYEAGERFRT